MRNKGHVNTLTRYLKYKKVGLYGTIHLQKRTTINIIKEYHPKETALDLKI